MAMGPPRKIIFVAIVAFLLIIIFFPESNRSHLRPGAQYVAQKVGLGESAQEWLNRPKPAKPQKTLLHNTTDDPYEQDLPESPELDWKEYLVPGTPKPAGESYRRVLVIPRTKEEDISWMDKEIPDVERVVYVADDPTAPLHPPANKGHEAMVYLTYIIDNYEDLPDVMIFMHAHQKAWHNNDVFGSDAAEMVKRLSSERVIREGYFNMRCNWFPGCPNWMHPGNVDLDNQKMEQQLIAKAWAELFPFDPVPDVLAQPCCSQYALSKERIQSIPKAQFEFYRNWILKTKLKDFVSGRIWEYMWQYAFTGNNYYCPEEHVCYCDGYGACFGGAKEYKEWDDLKHSRDDFNGKLLQWQQQDKKIKELREAGENEQADKEEVPEGGKDREWWDEIQKYQKLMNQRTAAAIERGNNPEMRAREAGRPWKEGDGF